jgi:signal transduction histidine kinase
VLTRKKSHAPMSKPLTRRMPLLRFGLRTRIASTMLLAFFALIVLFVVLFALLPARITTAYSARWLIATAGEAASVILQANEQERDALAVRLGADNHLKISWRRTWKEAALSPYQFRRPNVLRTAATIESDLKLQGIARRVLVNESQRPGGNILHIDVRLYPPDFVARMPTGPMQAEESDQGIPAPFEFAIEGLDGSWVVVEPQAHSYPGLLRPWIIMLSVAIALILGLSTIIARNTLRPLERLAESARNFGRTRKAVPIDRAGLHEFEVIAGAMDEMQDSIKSFIDERTRMLAALSHDLRTSLTSLLLDAEGVSGGDNKDRLIAGMEDMERVISATLAFAGDDLKGEQAQKIDLATLLISLCDDFSDRNYPASYSGPDHLFALCQPVGIKRAMTNVIDNAVKYGGCARVQLSVASEGAVISIADDGPGIPADKADLVFKPFGRLDYARNRESGGVGLGLTIARDIVQSHGGEIRLGVPPRGKGLEVLLSLPYG